MHLRSTRHTKEGEWVTRLLILSISGGKPVSLEISHICKDAHLSDVSGVQEDAPCPEPRYSTMTSLLLSSNPGGRSTMTMLWL